MSKNTPNPVAITPPYAVILAKVTMDGFRLTGRYKDRLQQVAETKAAPVAQALTWVIEPTEADMTRGKHFAEDNGYTLIHLTREEFDDFCLDKARARALAEFNAKKGI